MKRKTLNYSILSMAILVLLACNSNDVTEKYRLDKKFWDVKDYENAIRNIKFTKQDEKKPCYSVPDKAAIFRKIVDKSNVSVVVEDKELGLSHRSEFASQMFNQYRDLVDVYLDTDREDKYVYPLEIADILKFGLYLQLHYFDLGNQAIVQQADNPDAADIQNLLRNNEQTLVDNFSVYLDFIKQEKSFSEEGLNSYVEGINEYFSIVIDKFPDASFDGMRQKATDMFKKSESETVKGALTKLLSKLESKNAPVTPNQ